MAKIAKWFKGSQVRRTLCLLFSQESWWAFDQAYGLAYCQHRVKFIASTWPSIWRHGLSYEQPYGQVSGQVYQAKQSISLKSNKGQVPQSEIKDLEFHSRSKILPFFSNSRHDDEKGHQEGCKNNVDGECLDIGDNRGSIWLRIKRWSAMVAEQVKPASSHFDFLDWLP